MPKPRLKAAQGRTQIKRTRVADATITHRRTMDRVLDRTSIAPLRQTLGNELTALDKMLRRNVGHGSRAANKADLHVAKQHAHHHLLRIGRATGANMIDSLRLTQLEAVQSLAKFAHTMAPNGTSLDEDAVRHRIVIKHEKALAANRRNSAAALTHNIREAAKLELRALKLEDLTVSQLNAKVREISEKAWWQIERTVRTEASIAFNTAQFAAFKVLQEDLPGLMMRWTELVSDIDGSPLDKRVGMDSLVLHGQVARSGSLFTMPPHPLAPSSMVGKSWSHPPNRPNDRAVLTPWVPGEGVPAWQWVGGKRVNLK